jgi:hypothetical protein
MLTDVVMQGGGGPRGGDATSTGASTSAGPTAGSAPTSGTTTDPQSGRAMAPTTIMLNAASDVDLKPHVGHKIEVTGMLASGRGRGGEPTSSATGTATATGGTTAGAGTTASGSATGTGTSATTGGQVTGRGGPRSMTVTTVRMISESCS